MPRHQGRDSTRVTTLIRTKLTRCALVSKILRRFNARLALRPTCIPCVQRKAQGCISLPSNAPLINRQLSVKE